MTGLVCCSRVNSPHGADLLCTSALLQASWTPPHMAALPEVENPSCPTEDSLLPGGIPTLSSGLSSWASPHEGTMGPQLPLLATQDVS